MKRVRIHPPSSHKASLISLSSCILFLLTAIIGNFGVSDADVVLRQDDPLLHRGSTSNRAASSTIGGTSSSSKNPAVNSQQYQKHGLLDLNKNEPADASGGKLQEQLYFRLVPSTSRPFTPSSFHKQGEKSAADDLAFLEETAGDVDLGYPLPLSMDDYWALDRDRLLDQLIIRALANPEEWTVLRKAFEKVDGDLKALLSLEKGKNQAIHDGTTNSSLGYGAPSAGSSSGGTTSSSASASSSSSSTQNQEEHPHHHGLKWKFTYHRVRDLNAAGQPRSRGIAAVVSLDTVENESKNESTSNSSSNSVAAPSSITSAILKTSKGSTSSSLVSKDSENKARSEISSAHFDDPIQKPISRGGGTLSTSTTTSSSSNTNGNNNIISNSFSRFGNKGKHVDLASDKSSRSSSSSSNSDNSGQSSSVSNGMPKSALVLPTEIVSQGNEPNSHKIQWDPRHGQGGGRDELLGEQEVRQYGQYEGEGNDDHPARHHHHHHQRRDHHYHKNYHHHQHHQHPTQHQPKHHFQHQLSSSSSSTLRNGDVEVGHNQAVPATVELSQNQYHHLRNQHQHHNHHHDHDQHNHQQEKEQNHQHYQSNHQEHHHQHHPHRDHGSSSSWKRFHVDNPAKDK
ncbi:unnamed protein product [Orchesella dallaii]|uniref:Uncharacterized protein n=1 Tax=Orchesella dallaii TaxID=48710 RepID=A0ABP1Q7C2_9HEXA